MSWYNDIVSWLDTIMTRNGRNSITGTHANKMGKDLAEYTKSIEDKIGADNGIAELDENGKVKPSQMPNYPSNSPLEFTNSDLSNGILSINHQLKSECISVVIKDQNNIHQPNKAIVKEIDNNNLQLIFSNQILGTWKVLLKG